MLPCAGRGIESRLAIAATSASREDAGRIPIGNGPRALAAIGNAMLRPVHIPAGPLAAIREAVAAARHGAP